ncbi:hypothetical protein O181_123920 [Austropuccinia psidii MF-1]|uniref:Reverse transcriptase/retrotransposon-derived protein RNase H-like domain-containing protein n=1 Tax=Austropuccinia psidii MF-1 TaxID=1389203 RepID=A0A9Q3KM19_9BASI|nr:hypothetical protein [Austropuccinia psidii MF-1]
MVFSKSEEEHVTHVSTVLSRLRANNLLSRASKCLFHVTSVEYLGYFVPSEGLKMDQAKFTHKFPKERFPLSPNEEALRQFHQLKEAFTIFQILSHFDPSLPTIVETDVSDYALGAVLSHICDSGKYPIAFDSCKLLPAELNCEIYDKEPLGIVWALKRWRAFILSLSSSFEVLTDNSSLQYFVSSKILPCHEAHWAEFLSEFHFSITYHPGRLATLPDALSCQDNVYPEKGEDFISTNPMNYQKVIKQVEIPDSKLFAFKVEALSNLIESIQKALWQDSQYRNILQDLGKGKSVQDYSLNSSSQLFLFKDRVVVPNDPTIQLSILQKRHDLL